MSRGGRFQGGQRRSTSRYLSGSGDVALELKNFRIVGDDIALEGNLTLDAENEVREFDFPTFSLNVVSRLAVSGKVNSDKIWKITAKGSTFDAKDFFRSLVSLGKPSDQEIKPLRPANGFDFTGEIDTALGHSDINIRNLKIKLSNRKDQLVALAAQGQLENGKFITATMKPELGRKIFAESDDAGQAFRVVGFYPNLQGGRLKLEVDLDGKGAAEKRRASCGSRASGSSATPFSPTSMPATKAQVLKSTRPRRQARRSQKSSNSIACACRFRSGMGNSCSTRAICAPRHGHVDRGKVDYSTQRLNLGGTYVPLQGLNKRFLPVSTRGPIARVGTRTVRVCSASPTPFRGPWRGRR